MIILKNISLNNFLSHKSTDISLKEGDKLLLDGVSGSGKSSIIEALLWCLFGRGRVDNRSLVRRGAKEASVAVTLYDTEKKISYQIIRTATSTGKHSVGVLSGTDTFDEVGTGGVRDTEAYIVKLLGASYQLFVNSVVFPQDGVESFVSATGIRRKELLLEILKTAAVGEYLDKTKELIHDKEAYVMAEKATMASSIHLIETYDSKLVDLPHLLVREGSLEDQVKKSKGDLVLAEQAKVNIDSIYASVKDDEETLAKLKAKKWTTYSIDYTKELMERAQEDIKDEAGVREKLNAAMAHNNELTAIISDRPALRNYFGDIEAAERRIRQIVDDTLVCPSGDACPYSKLVGPELEMLKKELKRKNEASEQQNIEVINWERKVEAFGPRIDTSKLEALLANAIEARSFLERVEDIQEHEAALVEIDRLEKALANAPTAEGVKEVARSVVKFAEILSDVEKELASTRGQIAYLDTLDAEIKRLTKEVRVSEKEATKLGDELDLLEDLRDALGTNGITAVALDYLLPSLEDKINEVLGMLSDFRVVLTTQKDGAAGSKIEGLFITVVNEKGEKMDFDAYSGGERIRISVAISEALASLSRCGFRIMDEAISALDESMVDNFINVLSKIQGRYSQTISVSHIQSVKDTFENRITVTKVNGVSHTI